MVDTFISRNIFSKRKKYWKKIRGPMPSEEEICSQILANEVAECDVYLLGRACVRNNYIRAYNLLELLPEVNIITEAHALGNPLFNELSASDKKYVAMDDRKELAFNPREVSEWYNNGITYINTEKNVNPDFDAWLVRCGSDGDLTALKLYISGDLPPFVWGGMGVLISYIAYHGIIDACDKWLKYDISYYSKCIQYGILTNLAFAKYCLTHTDFMQEEGIKRTVVNTLIMNNIVPDCDYFVKRGRACSAVPYCIWYPVIPLEKTLKGLVEKEPMLKLLVGRVCAIAHYNELYDSLDIPADEATYLEAVDSGNTYITNKLENANRKYYMVDHAWFGRYFPDDPRDDGIVHVQSEVSKWYSRDYTGPDPYVKNPHLYTLINENTECYSHNPALQEGLGVQENTYLLEQ